jgi:hypothetical protein
VLIRDPQATLADFFYQRAKPSGLSVRTIIHRARFFLMELTMKLFKTLSTAAVLSLSLFTLNAHAALEVGDKAPDFSLKGALGGKPLTFSLQQALQKGPVVLYFFPAAFTKGCTLEAHAFAEASDDFKKLGATIVGVTAGNVDQGNLNRTGGVRVGGHVHQVIDTVHVLFDNLRYGVLHRFRISPWVGCGDRNRRRRNSWILRDRQLQDRKSPS